MSPTRSRHARAVARRSCVEEAAGAHGSEVQTVAEPPPRPPPPEARSR